MKTSNTLNQENNFGPRRLQHQNIRSQSSDRFFNPLTSYNFQATTFSQSISPQSFTKSIVSPDIQGNTSEEKLENAKIRILFLTSELERVNKLNQDLTKEIEILQKGQNDRASEVLSQPDLTQGITPSEFGNTQRFGGDRRLSSNGFEQTSNLSTSNIGSRMRGRLDSDMKSNLTRKEKKEEDLEKTIVTLYVENDKLNDALEQKMKEVHALSAKLTEHTGKPEERKSVSEMTGMVTNLLQENGKLIEIINKKDQEILEIKGQQPKLERNSSHEESFGKEGETEEGSGLRKRDLNELISKNEAINKILNVQSTVSEGYKQSFAAIDQFRTGTSQLIEENLKVNQLISDRMNNLREDLANALGALPINVQELRAQVTLLSLEKENLNSVIKDQLVEIGGLKFQLTQNKSHGRSGIYTLSGTTTDELYEEGANRTTSIGDVDRDQEIHLVKRLSQGMQREQFEELRGKIDGLNVMLSQIVAGPSQEIKDFKGLRYHFNEIRSSFSELQSGLKSGKVDESLIQQLRELQEAYGESMEGRESLLQRIEEVLESNAEERALDSQEVKSNLGSVINELGQLKKDFVNYHLELKALKNLSSRDKKGEAGEEHLKNMVQNLMQEKDQLYMALRQKDNDFEDFRNGKERELKNLHIQVSHLQDDLQSRLERQSNLPVDTPSKSVVETSFSEESTPAKVPIKRRPLTEEEAIVQENFQGKIDIVFCVDCTASMDPYIDNAKLACEKIMTVMNQSKNTFPLDLMFGFVGYRDHGAYNAGTWVTKVQQMCDIETCLEFINKMDAKSSNDNDFPEAVMPALWDCCDKVGWRDSSREKVLRIVFHIADAPPHGKQFYKGKNDKYPKGDPSGIRTEHVAQRFADLNIQYKLLKIGKFLDLMDKVFKQTFLDMESQELKKAEHLDQMTAAILVKQLDTINNEVSIKDKRFLNMVPEGDLKRSEKIGQCYFTSVLFDDYLEYFVEESLTDFRVRSLDIYHNQNAIVGVQCLYVTDDEEIEAPARMAHSGNVSKTTLEFHANEYIAEVSGELDQRGNIVSLFICTNMNKRIKVGGKGVRKFKVNVPPSGYVLAAVGGSYRNRGIDSLYFYYV